MIKKNEGLKKVVNVKDIPEVKQKYKVAEFYRDATSNKEHPVSKDWIMDFKEKWVLWARDDEKAMNPSYYVKYAGVPWDTCMNWCEKYPEVKTAYGHVRSFIALRRESKYIETNGSALAFMMPHYDEDYRAQHEWRSHLKNKEAESEKQNITIVIPDIGSKDV